MAEVQRECNMQQRSLQSNRLLRPLTDRTRLSVTSAPQHLPLCCAVYARPPTTAVAGARFQASKSKALSEETRERGKRKEESYCGRWAVYQQEWADAAEMATANDCTCRHNLFCFLFRAREFLRSTRSRESIGTVAAQLLTSEVSAEHIPLLFRWVNGSM